MSGIRRFRITVKDYYGERPRAVVARRSGRQTEMLPDRRGMLACGPEDDQMTGKKKADLSLHIPAEIPRSDEACPAVMDQ